MPVITWDSLDLVPEDFRNDAKASDDGKVRLDLVARKKLDEFRDTNITTLKERDELASGLQRYKELVGEDPDAFKADVEDAKAVRERVRAGELKESRQVEEAVNKRTDDMRRQHDEVLSKQAKETSAWKTKHEQLDARFKLSTVTSAIKDAALDPSLGVNPQALGEVVNIALGTYRADDSGRITPYDGDSILYGTTGDPMDMKEFIAKIKQDKPFLFLGSHGGGTGGGGSNAEKSVMGGYTRKDLMAITDPKQLLAIANRRHATK